MQLNIYKTPQETVKALADFFIQTAGKAIEENGKCTVALSGGNSPKGLYELLASPAYRESINWKKMFFFFCDERFVPFNDPDSNGLMAQTTLFDPLQLSKSQIFYIETSGAPESCARKYAKKILAHFNEEPLRFDLVLLGLGDNAHTASLFPNTPVLYEKSTLVKEVFVEELRAYRITLTAPLINEAANIAFLVFGSSKAQAVQAVLKGERNIEKYPAQLIEPEEGELLWFLDDTAASLIEQ